MDVTSPPNPDALLAETRWLQRLARALVGDGDRAADLAQDTMLQALQTARPVRSVRGFLATIARHLAGRQQRREARRPEVERRAARPEAQPPVDEVVARARLHRAVVDVVVGLEEPYRTTLLLRFLEDLPAREVAARTGVPPETARTRIKRGVRLVRARLDRRCGGRQAWAGVLVPTVGWQAVPATVGVLAMSAKMKALAAGIVAAAAVVLWQMAATGGAVDVGQVAERAGERVRAEPAGGEVVRETPAARRRDVAGTGESAAPQPDPITLVVTGRVVTEGDRVPLPGVRVAWFDASRPRPGEGRGTGPSDLAATRTDASGSFELDTTRAEAWRHLELVVEPEDRAIVFQRLGTPRGEECPARLSVGAISVPPGTGIHGRVVDAGGQPVAGAELLMARHWIYGNGMRLLLHRATRAGRSRPDGTFSLERRFVPRRLGPTLLAVADEGIGWTEVGLQRERAEKRGVLVPLRPGGALAVEVVDEEGVPVAGAEVLVEPRFLPLGHRHTRLAWLEGDGPLQRLLTGHTDEHGRAEFDALPIEPSSVLARTPGRIAARVTDLRPDHPAPVARVVLTAPRNLTLRGTVREPSGAPVPGATVQARFGAVRTATTDSEGHYTIEGLPGSAEPLHVRAEADGHTTGHADRRPSPDVRELVVDLELERTLPLHGIVVDDEGQPVEGARIHCADVNGRSDARGRFRLEGVPVDREHEVTLRPPRGGAWARTGAPHQARPGDSPLTLVLERLHRGDTDLEADVVDARGRALDPGRPHLVRLTDNPDGLAHPATGTVGRVTAGGLSNGRWVLRLDPPRGHPLERRFEVTPGAELVRLHLQQSVPGTVEGEVVVAAPDGALPDELPLSFGHGQRARWVGVPGQPYAGQGRSRIRLDPSRGTRFRIEDVDPSRPLTVRAEGGEWAGRATVQVRAGGSATMELHVHPAATLLLRSTEPWPFDGLVLHLRRPGEAWQERLNVADLAGDVDLFRWPIARGTWEWKVELPSSGSSNRGGPRARTGSVDVGPGGTAVVELDPGRAR